jgi:hypothetical protein
MSKFSKATREALFPQTEAGNSEMEDLHNDVCLCAKSLKDVSDENQGGLGGHIFIKKLSGSETKGKLCEYKAQGGLVHV